jgi:hypothetical protein
VASIFADAGQFDQRAVAGIADIDRAAIVLPHGMNEMRRVVDAGAVGEGIAHEQDLGGGAPGFGRIVEPEFICPIGRDRAHAFLTHQHQPAARSGEGNDFAAVAQWQHPLAGRKAVGCPLRDGFDPAGAMSAELV